MDEVTIIGLDLAKRVFQLHGARRDGSVAFRRKVSRSQLIPFLGKVPACIVAMVTLALAWAHACASRSKGRTNIETAGHGYRRKSWFRTGFDILRHWILTQPGAAQDLWQHIWAQAKYRSFRTSVV